MNTRLRVALSFVKSLMTCLAIIVLSVCGLFIRLRPAPWNDRLTGNGPLPESGLLQGHHWVIENLAPSQAPVYREDESIQPIDVGPQPLSPRPTTIPHQTHFSYYPGNTASRQWVTVSHRQTVLEQVGTQAIPCETMREQLRRYGFRLPLELTG